MIIVLGPSLTSQTTTFTSSHSPSIAASGVSSAASIMTFIAAVRCAGSAFSRPTVPFSSTVSTTPRFASRENS